MLKTANRAQQRKQQRWEKTFEKMAILEELFGSEFKDWGRHHEGWGDVLSLEFEPIAIVEEHNEYEPPNWVRKQKTIHIDQIVVDERGRIYVGQKSEYSMSTLTNLTRSGFCFRTLYSNVIQIKKDKKTGKFRGFVKEYSTYNI